jgi:hypothetical protein
MLLPCYQQQNNELRYWFKCDASFDRDSQNTFSSCLISRQTHRKPTKKIKLEVPTTKMSNKTWSFLGECVIKFSRPVSRLSARSKTNLSETSSVSIIRVDVMWSTVTMETDLVSEKLVFDLALRRLKPQRILKQRCQSPSSRLSCHVNEYFVSWEHSVYIFSPEDETLVPTYKSSWPHDITAHKTNTDTLKHDNKIETALDLIREWKNKKKNM